MWRMNGLRLPFAPISVLRHRSFWISFAGAACCIMRATFDSSLLIYIMNAPYKKLITAMTLMAVSAFPIASMANADDIQQRVKKVGRINIGEAAAPAAAPAASGDASAPAGAASGADLYQANCFACHGTGAAGAPILGNKDAWGPRIAQGEDTLVQHAINGLNAMPPRGGTTLTDDELKAVVMHMVESTQ